MKLKIENRSGYSYRSNELIKVQADLIKSLQSENSILRVMISDRDNIINKLEQKAKWTPKTNKPNIKQN